MRDLWGTGRTGVPTSVGSFHCWHPRHCHLPVPATTEARAGSATKCQLNNKMCRRYDFFRLIKFLGSSRDAWYRAAFPVQHPTWSPLHLPWGHGAHLPPCSLCWLLTQRLLSTGPSSSVRHSPRAVCATAGSKSSASCQGKVTKHRSAMQEPQL